MWTIEPISRHTYDLCTLRHSRTSGTTLLAALPRIKPLCVRNGLNLGVTPSPSAAAANLAWPNGVSCHCLFIATTPIQPWTDGVDLCQILQRIKLSIRAGGRSHSSTLHRKRPIIPSKRATEE
ncbi:hypothetical protein ZHAS_00018581 [Anopheles sinensis]|uniref:Uncharacterized protein n=1 Tax=Anopheles sinensis TaxID=74873 RepID=A0A084WJC1_ANOSI|nr:hypothetical protein ZHAS_00018581 [Anopheles sinensis]